MTSPSLPNIIEFDTEHLKRECAKLRLDAYRAAQIMDWVYKKGVYRFEKMTNLPADLRKTIGSHFAIRTGDVRHRYVSKEDGSVKLLLEMDDGELVETVYIPKGSRRTVCVSSQVGCKFKCAFCASGKAGFFRNLTAGEIVSQILMARGASPDGKLTNIVFMGIGEPMDNLENVLKAIRRLNDRALVGIGARKITISTCGVVPKILELANCGMQIELSVSLHGANDEVRGKLMPVNKRYPIAELLPACAEYTKKTKREITFEYILAEGLNASEEDARELVRVLKNIKCKINLIPLNPIPEFPYERPSLAKIRAFGTFLNDHGIPTTVRFSSGTDINAACGQLRSVEMDKEKKDHA